MNDELGEAYLSQRWNDRIRDAVFLDAIPSEHPVTVFLGGQPAAGKTDAYSLIEEMIPSIVPINGDDFRRFHPLYDLLLQYNPLGMPTATASASATWIAMTVAYANEHHYSSIIEGTWRDQSVVLNEAINAKKTGRGTWAMIVATKPSISRIGTLTRYLDKLLVGQIARWTPPSSHERVIRSLHSTVAAIAQDNRIDRFTVIDRHGETLADGHHRNDKVHAASVWEEHFDEPLTVEETNFAHNRLSHIDDVVARLNITDARIRTAIEYARQGIDQ